MTFNSKTAFIFPGEGTQYIGMGKELWERFPSVKKLFAQAEEVMDFPITQLCFEGPKEKLESTINAHSAILIVSVAASQALREKGIKPDVVAGHSIGEYTALVAAEALQFGDALRILRKLAQFVEETVPLGKMTAIIGLDREQVVAICEEANESGVVEPAAFNRLEQIVLSGEISAVNKAAKLAIKKGAEAVDLAVSAPFHSSLMKPVQDKLRKELDKVKINEPQIPSIANSKGQFVHSSQEVREALAGQVAKPVLWYDSIQTMANFGVSICIEVGPGKVLSKLIRGINGDLARLNVEDSESLDRTIQYLNNFNQ